MSQLSSGYNCILSLSPIKGFPRIAVELMHTYQMLMLLLETFQLLGFKVIISVLLEATTERRFGTKVKQWALDGGSLINLMAYLRKG